MNEPQYQSIRVGLVSISDRASAGVYQDEGLPALKDFFTKALKNPVHYETRLIPDTQEMIENVLCELVDDIGCDMVFTTGGTGPSLRDVTPEATLAIADKALPGFGEQMRQISLHYVPTAILSRQVAVIRKKTLVLNLPGRPKAISETLMGVKKDGEVIVPGIFASVPYCIDLLLGPRIETYDEVVKAFRPKK